MIDKLFTTSGSRDHPDTMEFVYYDCVLVKAIGDYPSGSFFSKVIINYDTKKMNFCENERVSFSLNVMEIANA